MGIGSNAELGLVNGQGAGGEGGEIIIGGGQSTDCWCGRITAGIHTGGGRAAEAGNTGHAAVGQGFVIHKPRQYGCKRCERLAVIALGLGVGRHAELGLVNGQGAGGEGGEVIIGGGQSTEGRRNRVVSPCALGRGGRASETGGSGHTAGG